MENIVERTIEKDLKESYLDYAMSVIVGRALPDIRDGLKPVHRRILFSMHELSNTHDKPYKKSARVVGETLGKFHPHGDTAIYDSLVRMAQDFSLRYTLVDGQGNFGSIDGDNSAAMRYTEVRMERLAEEMLGDLEKETVDFTSNFDGTLKEPLVMPSKIPNLLINGSAGIAVGMATNIPPHNLTEIVDASIAFIEGSDESKILSIVSGPDFPTAGIIVGRGGIFEAYKTGRGIIRIRGKAEIKKDSKGKDSISITEIPYQVTKTSIIESIANSVRDKKIDGISGVHDRSDRQGVEVIVELKKDANAEVVLNQLYAHTPLEGTFGIINLVLVKNEPKVLGLYELIRLFIDFRKEIVTKRCQFDLKKAEERAHILIGLIKALENIDPIVIFLKASKNVDEARAGLISKYSLSEIQANAILDMRLQRLIALEREKIENEYKQLQEAITWLKNVLSDVNEVLKIIKNELIEIKEKYGDKRRTVIIDAQDERPIEALIPNDEVVITITGKGYTKRVSLTEYRSQNRGGKGVIGADTKEEDFIRDVIVTRNHNYILVFTDKGRVHWIKAYEIPEAGRYAGGRPIVNIIELQGKDEKATSWIPVENFSENEYLCMVTKNGIIKRISLDNFSRPRNGGIIAITLKEKDDLVEVIKTNGKQELLIATKKGQAIRFSEEDAREIGRTGQGVIGIRFKEGEDQVVGITLCSMPSILTITENGFGKRTPVEDYRIQGRGGSGVINIKTEGRNGDVVGVRAVKDDQEIIVISSKGQTIRVPVTSISVIGRNTQGVTIIRLGENEKVASFAIVEKSEVQKTETQ
ncbi:DNA gyrase subunit A [Candidatus Micrarchaeota archaeon]|nr:DNA gyrase subunit A [Candidatus Micrarchaeota archaeon]